MLGGVVAGVAALAAVGANFAAIHPTDTSGRLWHQLGGWGTALVIWGIATAILQQKKSRLVVLLLIPLVLTDLWLFGYKFQQLKPISPAPFWRETVSMLHEMEQDVNGRILPWGISIFDQNGAGQVGLNSVFGYNALEVGALTALSNSVSDPRATSFDIFAADYVVANVGLDQFQEGPSGLVWLGERPGVKVYQRPSRLPVARLVYQSEVIPEQQAAIARLHQPDFSAATHAILAEDLGCPLGEPADGSATINSQRDGYWHITTTSEQPALLILSEAAYPGWRVVIDGEPVEWGEAYTAVRAVCVPAGTHEVEWRFRPMVFVWGSLLSLFGLACIVLAWRKL